MPSSRNEHNTVNQLYFNKMKKKKTTKKTHKKLLSRSQNLSERPFPICKVTVKSGMIWDDNILCPGRTVGAARAGSPSPPSLSGSVPPQPEDGAGAVEEQPRRWDAEGPVARGRLRTRHVLPAYLGSCAVAGGLAP